jgi:hypothetical protein
LRNTAFIELVGLFLLGACGGADDLGFVVKCDEFTSELHMVVPAKADVGESLSISVCADPATGVSWSRDAIIEDSSIVGQTGHNFALTVVISSDGTPAQAETWDFTAISPGETAILIESAESSGGQTFGPRRSM